MTNRHNKKSNQLLKAEYLIVALLLSAISVNFTLLTRVFTSLDKYKGDNDEYSLYEKRFTDLKSSLEPGKPIGYISDDYCLSNGELKDYNYGYNLAQYSLAPVVLVEGTNCDSVLGNYNDSSSISLISSRYKLGLIKDIGNGVMLFRKSE